MSRTFDVVVIGSGAGGAPVAERLARAGAKVLLVEKGKAYTRADFDRDEIEWCRRDRFVPSPTDDPHTWRNDEGKRAFPTTNGWISTVLGGGTVHMGAYLLRAHPDDARQASRLGSPAGHTALDWAVPFDDVARFYPTAEEELGVSGAPGGKMPPLAAHSLSTKVDAAAKKLGLPSIPTPRGIISEARPDDDRLACAYRQLCASYGCPNDAKSSMIATYLRRGQRSGNLVVETETMATRLERDAAGKVARVHLKSRANGDEVVGAGRVVLACGAIESARLLLLSGEGFNPGGQVGKNLWFSLFVEVTGFFARDAHADVKDLMYGSPFLNRTVLQGGHLSPERQKEAGVDRAGTLQIGFVHDNPIHRAERVATEGQGLLWGEGLKRALDRAFNQGRQVVVEGFGESVPHPGAYVDLDDNARDRFGLPAARITYFHHPRDQKVAAEMGRAGKALLEGMGAVDVNVTRRMSQTLVLQGGTCRFGNDEKTSVTRPDGRVHGVDNLYVTDGGALPSSTAVPTTLTIVANALRVAEGMTKG